MVNLLKQSTAITDGVIFDFDQVKDLNKFGSENEKISIVHYKGKLYKTDENTVADATKLPDEVDSDWNQISASSTRFVKSSDLSVAKTGLPTIAEFEVLTKDATKNKDLIGNICFYNGTDDENAKITHFIYVTKNGSVTRIDRDMKLFKEPVADETELKAILTPENGETRQIGDGSDQLVFMTFNTNAPTGLSPDDGTVGFWQSAIEGRTYYQAKPTHNNSSDFTPLVNDNNNSKHITVVDGKIIIPSDGMYRVSYQDGYIVLNDHLTDNWIQMILNDGSVSGTADAIGYVPNDVNSLFREDLEYNNAWSNFEYERTLFLKKDTKVDFDSNVDTQLDGGNYAMCHIEKNIGVINPRFVADFTDSDIKNPLSTKRGLSTPKQLWDNFGGLRGKPIATEQALKDLKARDYERRRVTATAKEYVFQLAGVYDASRGDIEDTLKTGTWINITQESMIVNSDLNLGAIMHCIPDAKTGKYEINGQSFTDVKLTAYLVANPIEGFTVDTNTNTITTPDWSGRYLGASGGKDIDATAGKLMGSANKSHNHSIWTDYSDSGASAQTSSIIGQANSNSKNTHRGNSATRNEGQTYARPETVGMPICIQGGVALVVNKDVALIRQDINAVGKNDEIYSTLALKPKLDELETNHVHLKISDITIAGDEPTLAEIQTAITTKAIKEDIVYYTATDTATDDIKSTYSVDKDGKILLLNKDDSYYQYNLEWTKQTDYLKDQPCINSKVLYHALADFKSGDSFDATKWKKVSDILFPQTFVKASELTVAIAGRPTLDEFTTYQTGKDFKSSVVYYNGTETDDINPTHAWLFDEDGKFIEINEASQIGDMTWINRDTTAGSNPQKPALFKGNDIAEAIASYSYVVVDSPHDVDIDTYLTGKPNNYSLLFVPNDTTNFTWVGGGKYIDGRMYNSGDITLSRQQAMLVFGGGKLKMVNNHAIGNVTIESNDEIYEASFQYQFLPIKMSHATNRNVAFKLLSNGYTTVSNVGDKPFTLYGYITSGHAHSNDAPNQPKEVTVEPNEVWTISAKFGHVYYTKIKDNDTLSIASTFTDKELSLKPTDNTLDKVLTKLDGYDLGFKANHPYTKNQYIKRDGKIEYAIKDFTSGATYNSDDWYQQHKDSENPMYIKSISGLPFPTTREDGTNLVKGDTVFLTAPIKGTGTRKDPQYPQAMYVWNDTDFVVQYTTDIVIDSSILEDMLPSVTYLKDEPAVYNGLIYKRKAKGATPATIDQAELESNWKRISTITHEVVKKADRDALTDIIDGDKVYNTSNGLIWKRESGAWVIHQAISSTRSKVDLEATISTSANLNLDIGSLWLLNIDTETFTVHIPNDSDNIAGSRFTLVLKNVVAGSKNILFTFDTTTFTIPANETITVDVVAKKLNDWVIVGKSGLDLSDILDEDDMASDSDSKLATQQSIKAYADKLSITQQFASKTDVNTTTIIPSTAKIKALGKKNCIVYYTGTDTATDDIIAVYHCDKDSNSILLFKENPFLGAKTNVDADYNLDDKNMTITMGDTHEFKITSDGTEKSCNGMLNGGGRFELSNSKDLENVRIYINGLKISVTDMTRLDFDKIRVNISDVISTDYLPKNTIITVERDR